MIPLGTIVDGRQLSYDATLFEFRVDRAVASFLEVKQLDDCGHVHWKAAEQHDWFRRINPQDLDMCNRKALQRHGNGYYNSMSPEEQVQADAKRDDSVLAGKIVEADPALVHAVAAALEEQGLVGQGGGAAPQTVIGMPSGMESLSQLQKQEGRKMTLMEHYLMRQILKNDDKEKVKREKEAAALAAAAAKEEAKSKKTLETKGKIQSGQRRMEKQEAATEQALRQRSANMQVAKQAPQQGGGMTIDQALAMAEVGTAQRAQNINMQVNAMNQMAAQNSLHYSQQQVVYYDSYGNPIMPEPDAMRPDMSQQAYGISSEAQALAEMRARNLAEQSRYQMQAEDVPGMEGVGVGGGGRRKRRNADGTGAMINGKAVNADGTPKETGFTKFVGGLGQVANAVSPLVGGGRGMGGGGGGAGGMGGGMGGGGMGGGMR